MLGGAGKPRDHVRSRGYAWGSWDGDYSGGDGESEMVWGAPRCWLAGILQVMGNAGSEVMESPGVLLSGGVGGTWGAQR